MSRPPFQNKSSSYTGGESQAHNGANASSYQPRQSNYKGSNYNPNYRKENNGHSDAPRQYNNQHHSQGHDASRHHSHQKQYAPQETSPQHPQLPPKDMKFQFDEKLNTFVLGPGNSLMPAEGIALPAGIVGKCLPREYYEQYEQYYEEDSEYDDDDDDDNELNDGDLALISQFEAEIEAERMNANPGFDDAEEGTYLVGDSSEDEEAAAKFDWFPISAKCYCCKGYIRNCTHKDPRCQKKCACDILKKPLVQE